MKARPSSQIKARTKSGQKVKQKKTNTIASLSSQDSCRVSQRFKITPDLPSTSRTALSKSDFMDILDKPNQPKMKTCAKFMADTGGQELNRHQYRSSQMHKSVNNSSSNYSFLKPTGTPDHIKSRFKKNSIGTTGGAPTYNKLPTSNSSKLINLTNHHIEIRDMRSRNVGAGLEGSSTEKNRNIQSHNVLPTFKPTDSSQSTTSMIDDLINEWDSSKPSASDYNTFKQC